MFFFIISYLKLQILTYNQETNDWNQKLNWTTRLKECFATVPLERTVIVNEQASQAKKRSNANLYLFTNIYFFLISGPTLINGTTSMPIVVLPSSCCRERPLVAAAFRNRMVHTISSTTTTAAPIEAPALLARKTAGSTTISPLSAHLRCITGGTVHRDSCHEKILTWLIHTAHILFVIGYCVIAFIKLCFLGILR